MAIGPSCRLTRQYGSSSFLRVRVPQKAQNLGDEELQKFFLRPFIVFGRVFRAFFSMVLHVLYRYAPRGRRMEVACGFFLLDCVKLLGVNRIPYYHRSTEKSLVALRKKQRDKIEQIKKQTNYYSTRNLLERYDEPSTTDSPLRRRVPVPASPAVVPVTPQRPQGKLPPAQMLQTPQPISPSLQQQLSRMSTFHQCKFFLFLTYS